MHIGIKMKAKHEEDEKIGWSIKWKIFRIAAKPMYIEKRISIETDDIHAILK